MGKSGFVPDNTNIKKTSGTPNLFFDSKDNIFHERDPENVVFTVTSTQLPAMVLLVTFILQRDIFGNLIGILTLGS
ncbi:hypothetical protein [Peribacillus sp. TH14]|uniref:hypothetical protein n=1 Tax=Peribacillus sp. TH14 TaxID=2798481 RepID=UPI00191240F0|nr:hypothetical protein [Peribacillus sp. TH14]